MDLFLFAITLPTLPPYNPQLAAIESQQEKIFDDQQRVRFQSKSVVSYATVTAGLCELGKTRALAPFPNRESAEAYLCPIGTDV